MMLEFRTVYEEVQQYLNDPVVKDVWEAAGAFAAIIDKRYPLSQVELYCAMTFFFAGACAATKDHARREDYHKIAELFTDHPVN